MAVEGRRLLARRLVRVTALLIVLAIISAGVVVFIRSDKLSEGGAARLERLREQATERCIEEFPADVEDVDPREACSQGVYVEERDPRFFLTRLRDAALGTTAPLIILAWLIGGSFVGAEWHAATMGTLLTWEPRRTRVLVAKLVTVASLAAVGALLVQVLLGAALLPSALLRGSTSGADAHWLQGTLGIVARGSAMAAFAAVLGFSISSVARNTAAALGAGFAYSAIIDPLVGAWRPRLQQWLLVDNIALFITGRDIAFPATDRTASDAGLLLLAYALVIGALAVALFRWRDVT
ncbi:MAG: hypothetical protein ABR529_07020 [Actinomycetota bacterium]